MPLHFDATYIARARGYAVPKRPGHVTTRRIPSSAFKPGNKMALKHGAYATAFVQFKTLRQELARHFKTEVGVDTAMLDAATLLFIRHGRAVLAGEQDLTNKTMASILAMLDRLKATKVSREGDKPARSEGNLPMGHCGPSRNVGVFTDLLALFACPRCVWTPANVQGKPAKTPVFLNGHCFHSENTTAMNNGLVKPRGPIRRFRTPCGEINASTVTRRPSDSVSTNLQNHRGKTPPDGQTFLPRHLATGATPNAPLVYARNPGESDRIFMPSHAAQKIAFLHHFSPKTAQNGVLEQM